MTHKEIIDKWLGGKSDYDKLYGFQCVDWSRQYCKDSGTTIGGFSGSAYKGWKTGSPFDDKWVRVKIGQ